jgi:hypothetical protein
VELPPLPLLSANEVEALRAGIIVEP